MSCAGSNPYDSITIAEARVRLRFVPFVGVPKYCIPNTHRYDGVRRIAPNPPLFPDDQEQLLH